MFDVSSFNEFHSHISLASKTHSLPILNFKPFWFVVIIRVEYFIYSSSTQEKKHHLTNIFHSKQIISSNKPTVQSQTWRIILRWIEHFEWKLFLNCNARYFGKCRTRIIFDAFHNFNNQQWTSQKSKLQSTSTSAVW